MDQVSIRTADRGDASAIAEVHIRCWQIAYRGLVPDQVLDHLSLSAREASWRRWLGDPEDRSFTLVATDDAGRIVGFTAAVMPGRDDDIEPDTAEIGATYVDPESWRLGIGTALPEASLQRLRQHGYRQVTLWVFARNRSARFFYRKLGFNPDGKVARHDLSGGELEVRLRFTIESPP